MRIKITTIDNSKYQRFETWYSFEKTDQVLRSHNDKPSFIVYYESGKVDYKEWHQNDKLHRSNNKPSLVSYSGNGKVCYKEWYLDGRQYSEQDYKQIIEQVKAMSDAEKLLDSRWWVREMVK